MRRTTILARFGQPGKGDGDFDVPARKAEFFPGLEHAQLVSEVVFGGGGEEGGWLG